MPRPIYMDHNATTPVEPRVLERMLPYFTERFGNASSRSHPYGWEAEEGVEAARRQLAMLIGAESSELVFTSGATEANNLAITGVLEAYAAPNAHVVSQVTEHKAVLDVLEAARKRGVQVTLLPVDAQGRLDPQQLAQALTPNTVLVSVMVANNEIGTLQNLDALSAVCRARGVLLHTDAAQALGRVPFSVGPVDLASFSAHKLYGPKGVGALYVRRKAPRVNLAPLLHGGGHERGRRSGTLNVPGIVGFGAACELAAAEGPALTQQLRALSERLYQGLSSQLEAELNGPPIAERLPGNVNLTFAGVPPQALLLALRDVALSSGAACASTDLAPSHVLMALGRSADQAFASLRFGLGRGNTEAEVDAVVAQVVEKVNKLRPPHREARAGI